jgi:hypothetical protein
LCAGDDRKCLLYKDEPPIAPYSYQSFIFNRFTVDD